jgi:hypothetical protein
MAAPAPLLMPSPLKVNSKVFTLTPNQLTSPIGSGYIQTIEKSPPMWYAEFITPPLADDAAYNAMITFLDGLNGSENTFLGYDPRRNRPQAHKILPLTARPWTNTSVYTNGPVAYSASYSNSTITLIGLSADSATNGLVVITKGDYISFKVGAKIFLHRAMETRTISTSLSGFRAWENLLVTPRPVWAPGDWTNASLYALCTYVRAPAQMKMIGAYKEDDDVSSFPILSWKSAQFVDRSV